MKKTGSLKVSVSTAVDREHLVMHPNDGFDLGLMRVEHPVRLCRKVGLEDYLKGDEGEVDLVNLALKNECPRQTILVGTAMFQLLGEPSKAVILYDGQRLFVHGQPS
jgi:hypothetical protein